MSPNEPSAEVMAKLDQATAARRSAAATEVPSPPEPLQKKEATVMSANGPTAEIVSNAAPAGAGSGTATYLLVDHYIGGSAGTLWGFAGGEWHAANNSEPVDEEGIDQVAFASNRVDVWWNSTGAMTVLRCWKNL